MGAVVVTTTTTLNRVMVIELGLPAVVSGFLVSLHYLIQMVRPRMGYGADQSKRCTPWIFAGMVVLSVGGILAALATTWMADYVYMGFFSALIAFCMIGVGVSACGTTLLVLLSKGVGDQQRSGAATAVWIMMIFGFAITSVISGRLLDPFSFERLLMVSIGVSVIAVALCSLCLIGLEARLLRNYLAPRSPDPLKTGVDREALLSAKSTNFKDALAALWRDDQARLFTFFVFTSMFAYSAQDLILEPFAGMMYHFTPGQTTQLSGTLHSAVLVGMLTLAFIGGGLVNGRLGAVSAWMSLGCLVSALGMLGLCTAGLLSDYLYQIPLTPVLVLLGFGNGLFSVAAISTMMRLATQGMQSRANGVSVNQPGIRMGLWGAAQAVAFGLGGIIGTAASDLSIRWIGTTGAAYSSVFTLEAAAFFCAAWIARKVHRTCL